MVQHWLLIHKDNLIEMHAIIFAVTDFLSHIQFRLQSTWTTELVLYDMNLIKLCDLFIYLLTDGTFIKPNKIKTKYKRVRQKSNSASWQVLDQLFTGLLGKREPAVSSYCARLKPSIIWLAAVS